MKDITVSEVWGVGSARRGGRDGGNCDYRVTSTQFLPLRHEKQEEEHIRHYCDGEEMQGPLK